MSGEQEAGGVDLFDIGDRWLSKFPRAIYLCDRPSHDSLDWPDYVRLPSRKSPKVLARRKANRAARKARRRQP